MLEHVSPGRASRLRERRGPIAVTIQEAPGFRPLYRQVYDYLKRQIADGHWGPAEALPSEQALAGGLGVSQGTVRKALDAMAAEQLVERRQGKGTYVAAHTEERALFRFFRLATPEGERPAPASADEARKVRPAAPEEAGRLALAPGETVHVIERTRLMDGAPVIYETIIAPERLFPGLSMRPELPNALYELYQRSYGVTISLVEEQLRADIARKTDVRRLGLPLGAPLLHIDRVAFGLDGGPAELRISRCDTRRFVYAVSLR
jgi:GntR family transcriptional regulator